MSLIEEILIKENLSEAIKRVKANKRASGIDKMTTNQLDAYFYENKKKIINSIRKESSNIDIESKISKLETRKDKLYQLTKKVYDDALNEIIDSETSSKMIKEYQEEQKKISSEIETLKNLKQEEESIIENYKLLKEKVN